jgi:hypothetical protein
MRLSLQPGLNEALYRILQRKQRKRNCEKQRINFGSNNRKLLPLQPQSKMREADEEEGMRRSGK